MIGVASSLRMFDSSPMVVILITCQIAGLWAYGLDDCSSRWFDMADGTTGRIVCFEFELKQAVWTAC